MDKEVERVWREFWLPIVTRNGNINLSQIKRELYDYHEMMDEVSKVYDEVTWHQISKPNTRADAVISIYNDHLQEVVKEAIKEAIDGLESRILESKI